MISSLHNDIILFLNLEFSYFNFVTEYKFSNSNLRVDIYLPDILLGIEIQGIQHYEYSDFFHKNSSGFLNSNLRDRDKNILASKNGVEILYIKYNEKKFKEKIRETIERKVKELMLKEQVFLNHKKYSKDEIEELLCPYCRIHLSFSDIEHPDYGSIKKDNCCKTNFYLIEDDDEYLAIKEKVK
jgi:hypothetical protein